MARAHSIFILRRQRDRSVVGAWTVKRELIGWLARCNITWTNMESIYEVIRVRDGKPGVKILVPLEEIV
jgi:hypothetical protein